MLQGLWRWNAEGAAAQAWQIDAGGAWAVKCGRRRSTTWRPGPQLNAEARVRAAEVRAHRAPVVRVVAWLLALVQLESTELRICTPSCINNITFRWSIDFSMLFTTSFWWFCSSTSTGFWSCPPIFPKGRRFWTGWICLFFPTGFDRVEIMFFCRSFGAFGHGIGRDREITFWSRAWCIRRLSVADGFYK